jgi:sulfur carrier protein
MITVIANGEEKELPDGAVVSELLDVMGLGAKWVVAELNGEPVNRDQMGSTTLSDGDKVELVRAVAGG